MSGIGNTIETDLVGEHIELWRNHPRVERVGRGRCRAITPYDRSNGLNLWLEVVDERDRRGWPFDTAIGDVVLTGTDDGGYPIKIRLIKNWTPES